MVAKSILSETRHLVHSGDKHACTAGIILLQDFVELVVLAALDERDVDEQRSLESKSFNELLGELKKAGVQIIKSGTIKALNQQRVISKHYGQLAEPVSVINYFNAATKFVDALLQDVVGAKLQEIFLADILKEGEIKNIVKESIEQSGDEKFLDALSSLRKAFFLAYEIEYSVYAYRSIDANGGNFFLNFGMSNEGTKSPYWARNKQWIEANVKRPADYIQINYDQLKTDCMELGVSTVDIENFRRLTPEVMRTNNGWHLDYSSVLVANELNKENFNYCLDLLIDFLLKKQKFEDGRRFPRVERSIPAPPIYVGKPVFLRPSRQSEQVCFVQQDYYYLVERVVTGFDPSEKYLFVHLYPQVGDSSYSDHKWGYLIIE